MTMENSDQVLLKARISIWVPPWRAKEANKYGNEQNCIKVTLVTRQACPCKTSAIGPAIKVLFYHKTAVGCAVPTTGMPLYLL